MKKYLAILVSVLLLFCSCQAKEEPSSTPLPEYKIARETTRQLPGKLYRSYAILISAESTDEELLSVAHFLLDDGCNLHDFYFFRKAEEINSGYTVGKIREEDDGSLTLDREGGLVEVRDYLYPDSSAPDVSEPTTPKTP